MGGSFDPVHLGHLGVARRAREAFDLDVLWFIPAHRPPHKLGRQLAEPRDRVAMLELALCDLPWARVEPLELGREGPSYTYDTVVEILERYEGQGEESPAPHLHLIMGGDNLPGLPDWYRAAELLELVTPIVMRRKGDSETHRDPADLLHGRLPEKLLAKLSAGYVDLEPVPGRSSFIRRDLEAGARSLETLPPGIEAFVLARGLYGTRPLPESPGPGAESANPLVDQSGEDALMNDVWNPMLVMVCALAIGGALSHYGPRLLPAREPQDPFEARNSKRPVRQLNVPRVGGLAVLLVLPLTLLTPGMVLPWPALLAAWALGAIDDRWPLAPGLKAGLQLVPAALLAWQMGAWAVATGAETRPFLTWLWVLPLTWVAQNLVNTWDHADGFACGLAGMAMPPVVAAAFLGVLPWNLLLRKKQGPASDPVVGSENASLEGQSQAGAPAPEKTSGLRIGLGQRADPSHPVGPPHLFLGDAGSHLTAILFVWFPLGRWFLVLPALDLARVVFLRLRARHPIWKGDRRHLGHHLQGLGWPPKYVAVAGLAPAAPLLGVEGWGVMAALSCAIFWACLLWASQPMSGTGRP